MAFAMRQRWPAPAPFGRPNGGGPSSRLRPQSSQVPVHGGAHRVRGEPAARVTQIGVDGRDDDLRLDPAERDPPGADVGAIADHDPLVEDAIEHVADARPPSTVRALELTDRHMPIEGTRGLYRRTRASVCAASQPPVRTKRIG